MLFVRSMQRAQGLCTCMQLSKRQTWYLYEHTSLGVQHFTERRGHPSLLHGNITCLCALQPQVPYLPVRRWLTAEGTKHTFAGDMCSGKRSSVQVQLEVCLHYCEAGSLTEVAAPF